MIEKIKKYKVIATTIVGLIAGLLIYIFSGVEEIKEVIEVETTSEVVEFDKEPIMEGIDTIFVETLVVDSL